MPPSLGDGDGDQSLGNSAGASGESDDFSVLLDRSAVLAASPLPAELPSYFFFEPGSGNLSYRRQDGETSSVLGTWTWPAPEGVSHLAVVPYPEGLTLLSYDQISGSTSQATLNNQGEFEIVSTDIGTSGRTEVVAFYNGEEWLAFVYSVSDGNYRYFRPLPSDRTELFAGISEPGFTSIDRFAVGEDAGLLKHNRATGLLQFDRFVAVGEPLQEVFKVSLDESFSDMVTFGDGWILLYQEGPGTAVTGRIVQAETGAYFSEAERGHFRGNLSQITPLAGTLSGQAFTFSAASGQAVLRNLAPLEGTPPVVVR
jgi:hypothetical protein